MKSTKQPCAVNNCILLAFPGEFNLFEIIFVDQEFFNFLFLSGSLTL